MNRREFLVAAGLMTVSGKMLCDTLEQEYQKERESRIYNKLPQHIYTVKTVGKIKNIGDRKNEGIGGIIDGKFVTVAHVTDIETIYIPTIFGMESYKGEIEEKKVYLDGKEMKELVYDRKNDIAIYETDGSIENFPCEPTTDISLGDKVFILGNPGLEGKMVREAHICSLTGYGKDNVTKDCFAVNTPLIPGDSGGFVVNEDYKMIGVTAAVLQGTFGYIKKYSLIQSYLKDLK